MGQRYFWCFFILSLLCAKNKGPCSLLFLTQKLMTKHSVRVLNACSHWCFYFALISSENHVKYQIFHNQLIINIWHCIKYRNFTKFCSKLKLCGNCALPQNFHTIKLGENTIFYAVLETCAKTAFLFNTKLYQFKNGVGTDFSLRSVLVNIIMTELKNFSY